MESEYILVVATNQDVLLFKFLTFFGVLLTEACYCSRLYGKYVVLNSFYFSFLFL